VVSYVESVWYVPSGHGEQVPTEYWSEWLRYSPGPQGSARVVVDVVDVDVEVDVVVDDVVARTVKTG